jgi:hypothetical protein
MWDQGVMYYHLVHQNRPKTSLDRDDAMNSGTNTYAVHRDWIINKTWLDSHTRLQKYSYLSSLLWACLLGMPPVSQKAVISGTVNQNLAIPYSEEVETWAYPLLFVFIFLFYFFTVFIEGGYEFIVFNLL